MNSMSVRASGHLTALLPREECHHDRSHGQADAELANHEARLSGIRGERIEDPLNPQIVTRVQKHASPDAATLESHPGEDEADADDHQRETGQRVALSFSPTALSRSAV